MTDLLNAEKLEVDASKATTGREALERLVRSINEEAGLTPSGIRVVGRSLQAALQIQQDVARQPRPQGRAPYQVLVVTGLHRTGTTLLQSLLAAHPGVRAPQLWELLAPAAAQSEAELVTAAERYVEEYYRVAPGFAAIHPLHARKPEECHRLTATSFHSEIFGLRYRVPSYLDWLRRQDHTPAYDMHRSLLDLVLRRVPGDHVVLKCPFHLWHPKELAAAYPHARVVRLHRDPATTIASVCSLTATIRAARAYHVDRAELGDHWLARTKEALLERGADDGGLPVLDMRYPDLVADPVSVVRRVCEFAGLPFHGEAETRVRRAVRPPAGGHHYRLEDFGLDATRTALAFAAYRAAYDL